MRVGGVVITDPARDVEATSGVEVDGSPVAPEPREVWMPEQAGGRDLDRARAGQRTAVVELVASASVACIRSAGSTRDSTGLILLTNDGELANRLTHPRFEVAGVPGPAATSGDERQLRAASGGGGARRRPTAPAARAREPARGRSSSTLARGAKPPGAADGARRSATG